MTQPKFLVGVDGGGSGTRLVLADGQGRLLGRGAAGPSGLALGSATAWREIGQALAAAGRAAGMLALPADCALGAGLAGVNHPDWQAAFVAADPGYARVCVSTDGHIAVLAAHQGRPGAVVAAGTGSVGEALLADGSLRSVGGWGFPVGDEGSGAWLGLAAMRHAQAAMDGRVPAGGLAHAVWQACGSAREPLLAWSLAAGQGAYAALAPQVFACAAADPVAAGLLDAAAAALETIALALDPGQQLPLAFMGSVGSRLLERCSPRLRARASAGDAEAALGALRLVRATARMPA